MRIQVYKQTEIGEYVAEELTKQGHDVLELTGSEVIDAPALYEVTNVENLTQLEQISKEKGVSASNVIYFTSAFGELAKAMTEVPVCYLNPLAIIRNKLGKLNYPSSPKKRQWAVGKGLKNLPVTPHMRWAVVGDSAVLDICAEGTKVRHSSGTLADRLAESYGYIGVDVENILGETYLSAMYGTLVHLPKEHTQVLGSCFHIDNFLDIEAYSNANARLRQHLQIKTLLGHIPPNGMFEEDVKMMVGKFEVETTDREVPKSKVIEFNKLKRSTKKSPTSKKGHTNA